MSYVTEYILINASEDQIRAANLIYEQTQDRYDEPEPMFRSNHWVDFWGGGAKMVSPIALSAMNYFDPSDMYNLLREVDKDFPFDDDVFIVYNEEDDDQWECLPVVRFINARESK